MKIVSICDDEDICTGLQLAGIGGCVVHNPKEFSQIFEEIITDDQIGILVITKKLFNLHSSWIDEIRLGKPLPLIVQL